MQIQIRTPPRSLWDLLLSNPFLDSSPKPILVSSKLKNFLQPISCIRLGSLMVSLCTASPLVRQIYTHLLPSFCSPVHSICKHKIKNQHHLQPTTEIRVSPTSSEAHSSRTTSKLNSFSLISSHYLPPINILLCFIAVLSCYSHLV